MGIVELLYSSVTVIVLLISADVAMAQDNNSKKPEKLYNTLETRISDSNDEGNVPAILNDPSVRPVYDECKKGQPNSNAANYATKMQECLAKGVGQEKMNDLYEKYMKLNSEQKDSFESLNQTELDNSSDPAILKLEEYYLKKLKDAMYGEIKNNTYTEGKVADHGVFWEMFESQLGKNVVSTVTYYCIDANSENKFYINENDGKRKAQRQKNLKSLTSVEKNGNPVAYVQWSECITQIQDICHNTSAEEGEEEEKKDKNYSKQRACVVTANLRALKQNLFAIDDLKKAAEANAKEAPSVEIVGKQNTSVYRGLATSEKGETKNIDHLTTLTSNEVINTSGYGSALEVQAQELQAKCIDAANSELCKKYLNSSEEKKKLEKAMDEYVVESGAIQNKIEKEVTDEAGVEKYMKDERREKVEEMVNSDNAEILKDKIQTNYEQEREMIIKQLAENINKTSVAGKSDDPTTVENKGQLEGIKKQIESTASEYKELVHFNNVISGYFSVEDSSGKKLGANTQTLAQEMADSAFASDKEVAGRSPSNLENSANNYGAKDFKLLQQITDTITQQNNQHDDEDENNRSSASLSPDQINDSMLGYGTEEEQKRAEERQKKEEEASSGSDNSEAPNESTPINN